MHEELAKLWKLLVCSWLHRKYRCYPEVHPEYVKFWHCSKCHPCDERVTDFETVHTGRWTPVSKITLEGR